MRQKAIIHWGMSSFFGWGIYGLNLALAWSLDTDVEPLCAMPIQDSQIALDRLRRRALDPFIAASADLAAKLAPSAGRRVSLDVPVLSALGNDFKIQPAVHGTHLVGRPTIGVVFFEVPQLDAETLERARALPLIVAGSTWNEKILREYGLSNVVTVLQGIDPTLFHPAPRLGVMGDRFCVFSGGKLELRKGQDLVVAAFARFARRHPEALLVSAWHSPWPQLARGIDASRRAAPMVFGADGQADTAAWVQASGIAPSQYLDLGAVPNAFMPQIYREMDVALFPNRSEGGTNLVAMEAMACGVPAILSANTGHLDLLEGDGAFPLTRQTPVGGIGAGVGGTAGWGESDIDEIEAHLETVFADRAAARARGLKGAGQLARLTWAATADAMKAIVLNPPAA